MSAEITRLRPSPRLLAAAALLAVVCWWLGTDVWHALAFGAVLTVLGTLGRGGLSGVADDPPGWRDGGSSPRPGGRGDVAELGRALRGERGRVSGRAVRRVADLAERRLAARGLSLRDPAHRPAVEALVGRRSYRILADPRRRPPRLRALVSCLDALDALTPPRPPEAP